MRKGYEELLKRLFVAKDSNIKKSSFDNRGNVSFGIDEYVHVPGLKYDPTMPMFGFNVTITLERPGYRVKKRRLLVTRVPRRHFVNQEDAIEFLKKEYGVNVI